MSRHSVPACFVAVFSLLLGCGESRQPASVSSTSPSSSPAPSKSKGTIGFSTLTLTNPFFKTIADSMKAEFQKEGYELIVVSAERDVKTQSDQVHEFIVKGVAAIVLNPCDTQAIGPA